MNEQVCVAYNTPNFRDMTSEQIIAYFAHYGFTDIEQHKLELCDDFIQLVRIVSGED